MLLEILAKVVEENFNEYDFFYPTGLRPFDLKVLILTSDHRQFSGESLPLVISLFPLHVTKLFIHLLLIGYYGVFATVESWYNQVAVWLLCWYIEFVICCVDKSVW